MIGTKFYKPLEADKLFRTVIRTVEREVEEQVAVPVKREETRDVQEQVAVPVTREEKRIIQEPVYNHETGEYEYEERTVIKTIEDIEYQTVTKSITETVEDVEYQTVTKKVTEDVEEQEEYDNPAHNTYAKYREAAQWCNVNGALIVDKGDYYEVEAIPEPTLEERIEAAYKSLDAAVETRLNTFAATRKYSSINSACSYATSTDPQFRLEGEYCVQARDLTYRACYDLLAEYMPEVQAGMRAIPTWVEIEPLLPELKWPDEV